MAERSGHQQQQQHSQSGILFGIAAYGLWGLMPLYFRAVAGVEPLELLAHRIVWSVLLLAVVLSVRRGGWGVLRNALGNARTRRMLLLSTLLIAANWFVFIYGVSIGQIVQNSLGYFINPLLNVLLGVVVFGERLRGVQRLALLLAGGGLAYLILALGQMPWIALFLAGSFAAYGLLRKTAPVDGLVGLTAETLLLLPVSLVFLLVWWRLGRLSLGGVHSWGLDVLLLLSGVVTTVPLLCFGEAARRLRLSTLGFLQYLAPTIQLLIAVLAFGEPFGRTQQISFAFIWSALALVTVDSLLIRWRAAAAG